MALEPPRQGFGALLTQVLGEETPAGAKQLLLQYLDEVITWNRKMDLTAARSPEELVDLTVADALVVARASQNEGRWIDVGSGAGAPGLVLAFLLDAIDLTLVEPRDRRVAFLRSTIGKLKLARTMVERGRSDRLGDAGWDVAISRATLSPPMWLREGARLSRSAVWVLLAREEPPVLEGFVPDTDIRYEWPLTGVPRRALRYVARER